MAASASSSASASSAVVGQLVPKNVVSTYFTKLGDFGCDINLPAVAVVCSGKYGRGVFPAVVSKARIPISGVDEAAPSPASLYPLQKKVKLVKSATSKQATHVRNKKLKAMLHEANQLAPKQYLTATDSQFKSGQNVVAGGTSVASNTLIAYMFIRRLSHDLGLDLRVYNMQTQNIVCSTYLGYELNPEWIVQEADAHGWEVYYCPEEFIGLSWITNEHGVKIVFVVFSTGKIVATGIKTMEQIPIAEERMHRLIGPFRRGREPASFDAAHPHMRDSATLTKIKSDLMRDSVKSYRHTKANAAKRNSNKLSHEVRVMMKQIACVIDEEDGAINNGNDASMEGSDENAAWELLLNEEEAAAVM